MTRRPNEPHLLSRRIQPRRVHRTASRYSQEQRDFLFDSRDSGLSPWETSRMFFRAFDRDIAPTSVQQFWRRNMKRDETIG